MTFKDISNMIGRPLCKTASKEKRYWFQKNPGSMTEAWSANGYTIKNISLKDQKITFAKEDCRCSIKIPEVLAKGRIPKNATTELEFFFEYIIQKYGL